MKKILLVIGIFALLGAGLFFSKSQVKQTVQNPTTATPSPTLEQTNIKASFKIITNSTTRIFTDPKYHHKSVDVYLELPDPSIVHIRKSNITWDDLFKTLPMKLTKDCLTTGTGQNFCTGNNGTLTFYINNKEDKDALGRQIKEGDNFLVEFK